MAVPKTKVEVLTRHHVVVLDESRVLPLRMGATEAASCGQRGKEKGLIGLRWRFATAASCKETGAKDEVRSSRTSWCPTRRCRVIVAGRRRGVVQLDAVRCKRELGEATAALLS